MQQIFSLCPECLSGEISDDEEDTAQHARQTAGLEHVHLFLC